MNPKQRFSRSLTTEFSILTSLVLLILTLANIGLVFYEQHQLEAFQTELHELEKKEQLALELENSFNLAISEMRAYYAYRGEPVYFEKVIQQRDLVTLYMAELQVLSSTPEDREFNQQAREFYSFYFRERVPTGKEDFDKGNYDAVVASAVTNNGTEKVRDFQTNLRTYTENLAEYQVNRMTRQNQQILFTQVVFAVIFLLLVSVLAVIIRRKIRAIRDPLNELTTTATLISDGEQVVFTNHITRNDELGLLSLAFEKMSKSIMENEEELQAQNEELIAQQDTLRLQQKELEEALKLMRVRENELSRRNELVHGLANSLNRQTVLNSIVRTLTEILQADKGVIVVLDDLNQHASTGISTPGVLQFKETLNGPLMTKLNEVKKSFTIKRESLSTEKGYHTGPAYSYDLYIPIISVTEEIIGVMAYTRYDHSFDQAELIEYDQLSKQIAISLDNLSLFEQTEKDRQLNQQILDNIQEGIQLVDTSGAIITVNRTMAAMVETNITQLRHCSYGEWSEEWSQFTEEPEKTRRAFHSLLFKPNENTRSFIYHQVSPHEKVVEIYAKPLIQDEELKGTVLVHRDITREYEVDAMKSEFVSTVSHELRTPLASVLGFTELLLRKELKPERQKKYLETIYQEATRLTNLINDFLDVQRMEAGKQKYEQKKRI